ncbi:MAG: DoxX family protein [Flavobacteriales bacterium]|nr:DoxX family protein [Flavobacteriales bacterium]
MYFVKYEHVSEEFVKLGFPTFIIYPLAILKILGLVAVWSKKSKTLKEWANAGFFFDFLIAAGAHITIGDGEYVGAVVATILLLTSDLS